LIKLCQNIVGVRFFETRRKHITIIHLLIEDRSRHRTSETSATSFDTFYFYSALGRFFF